MGKKMKKMLVLMLTAAMAVTPLSASTAQAKKSSAVTKKTLKLSKTKTRVKAGKKAKIHVKNKTKLKIKSVKWTVIKGKKFIQLSKKTKKSVTVKGVKKGTATVRAKIKIKAQTVTRTVNVTVTKKAQKDTAEAPSASPASPTATPSASPASPTATPVPADKPAVEGEELIHYNMTCSQDGKFLLDQSGNGNDAELFGVSAQKKEYDSLLLEKNGSYIKLPEKVFAGKDSFTVSIWLKNYSGAMNTSAMFVGTKENLPVSYWLLNPSNLAGQMKSVMTNSVNAAMPYNTETGISPTIASNGVAGPVTGKAWNHYVTVITADSITGYFNGKKVGSSKLNRKFSDFGNNLAAYIGKSSYQDPTWAGFVREVQVFNGAKTESEITQLYEKNKIEGDVADEGPTGTKTDIFIADRADPYIIKSPTDGSYYFTASYPMYRSTDAEGYDRIVLRKSATLDGLKDNATEKTVWDEKDSSTEHRFIWAPELHYIGGKWYLYYASSGLSNNRWDINCHVLMCKGDDPYNDEWEAKGKFQAASGDTVSFTGFSLDMTYFECKGKSYVIWAQKIGLGTSNLYMAEVDPEEPWKAKTKAMLLTKPEYYWECRVIPVNEGPSVLIHDGKVIVAYSASATGPEYCIGFMYADEDADLLDINSWTKQGTAALTSDDLIEEYGPGHNSFTKDEQGNDIFVYQSRSQTCYEGKCGYGAEDPLYDPCRSARIRKVKWGENGLPILNQ